MDAVVLEAGRTIHLGEVELTLCEPFCNGELWVRWARPTNTRFILSSDVLETLLETEPDLDDAVNWTEYERALSHDRRNGGSCGMPYEVNGHGVMASPS